MRKTIRFLAPLFLIIALSWFIIQPLTISGFFPMHDDTQVARVYEMGRALSDGQFPVRLVSNLGYGYGYPLFNFYSPLPYYIGGVLTLFGIDALVATKIMFGIGIILAGIGMYFLGRRFFGSLGGVLSSVLYLYAPYHGVQIYVRGAVAEFWGYALMPFVLLSFIQVFTTRERKWVLLGGISYGLLILSHNIVAVIFTAFIVIWLHCYMVWGLLKKKKIPASPAGRLITYCLLLTTILLGLSLSAFFWLPALVEIPLTKAARLVTEVNFRDHFVYPDQLWESPWGFAGSSAGRADGMSFKLGKLHMVLALFGIGSIVFRRKLLKKTRLNLLNNIVFWSVSLLGISVFMMLGISKPVWEFIGPLAYIQFPWRFLNFALFALSLLAGGIIFLFVQFHKTIHYFAIFVLIGGILFFNVRYFQPQTINSVISQDYTNPEELQWHTSKISDEYLPKDFPIPSDSSELPLRKISPPDDIIVKDLVEKSQAIEFITTAAQGGLVVVEKAYFPGWQVIVGGHKVPIVISNGKIGITIPKGESKVEVRFVSTPIRKVGNLISVTTITFLVGWFLYDRQRKFIS